MAPATEYILNTSLTLAGIVLLAWLLVYASRRWERAAPRGPLELIGTLRLEGKRAVYLVRIGERVVALGAAEGGMSKVLELSPAELGGLAQPSEGFPGLFRRLKTRGAGAHPDGAHPDGAQAEGETAVAAAGAGSSTATTPAVDGASNSRGVA